MDYALAIIFPPLAILLAGKPFQAVFNILLCLLFWIPGVIHALVIVGGRNADRRQNRLVKALRA